MLTDDQARDLGLRAVACEGWRLQEGILLRHLEQPSITLRVVGLDSDQEGFGWMLDESGGDDSGHMIEIKPRPILGQYAPDYRDGPTLGVLLSLVRGGHGMPCLHATHYWTGPGKEQWSVVDEGDRSDDAPRWRGPTEAEALVAALEAAPGAGGEG